MKRNLPLVIIGAVLVLAFVVGYVMFRSKRANAVGPLASQPTPVSSTGSVAKAVPSATTAQTPVGISVLVEEYGDYQCPPCGTLYPQLKQIEADYGPRVNFVFHNLPLSKIHKNALAAARAAEAARLQGSFQQMHDLLYEHQNDWKDQAEPRTTFAKYAQTLGLDVMRFARDMAGPVVQQSLTEDQQRADALGLSGTPTILIEGKELKPEATTGDGIRKGIELMLARKTAKP